MSESKPYAVRGRIITPDSIIVDGAVVIQANTIVWMGESVAAQAAGWGAEVATAESPTEGQYLLPGLIDVHCHGGGGQSFPDAETLEDAMIAVWEHRLHGTTTMVGSLTTLSPQGLRRQGQLLADLCDMGELAGIHFEGPFIDRTRCGALDAENIQAPNPALTRELLISTRGHTVSMTLAPEGKRAIGSGSVADVLIENGAIPSYGHTSATSAQMREAATYTREKLGLMPAEKRRCSRYTITHLFNGMEPLRSREPGPVLECLSDAASGGCILELIADGVHVHPDNVRNVFELVGRDAIVLVTDAMAAAGMDDGEYVLGGQKVIVAEGKTHLGTADGSPAGSTAHLLDVVRTAWRDCKVPLIDAVYCATKQGARILGDDTLGEIAAGKRADLLVTDAELYPLAVYRQGIKIASGE